MQRKERLMTGFVGRIGSLLALLVLSACATIDLPSANLYVTLPASGIGFGVNTLTGKETEIPAKEWKVISRRGVILLSEDWAKIKLSLLKACMANECRQSVGALDELFYTLDDALKKIP